LFSVVWNLTLTLTLCVRRRLVVNSARGHVACSLSRVLGRRCPIHGVCRIVRAPVDRRFDVEERSAVHRHRDVLSVRSTTCIATACHLERQNVHNARTRSFTQCQTPPATDYKCEASCSMQMWERAPSGPPQKFGCGGLIWL